MPLITLPTHKFGIELEVSGISPQMATDAINRVGVEAVNETYNHRTRNYWKVTTDSSIQSDNGLSCEIVSPILTFGKNKTLIDITKVVKALVDAGAKVNESCGFHVHVNCQGITDPDFFRTLLSLYSSCEAEIDSLVPESRREDKNRFCRSNHELFNNWERFWSNYIDPTNGNSNLNTVFADVARYYKLNFNSYTRHGTVEFRQLQGTLNIQKILGWISFCVAIVNQTNDFVMNNKSKFVQVVPADVNRFKPIPAIAYLGGLAGNLDNFDEAFRTIGGFALAVNPKLNVTSKATVSKYYQNALFSNTQTNAVYKLMMAMFAHYSTLHSQIVTQTATGRRRDDGYRELSFAYNTPKERQSMHNALTAAFFGFDGTEDELTRKTNAKLKNVGLRYNSTQNKILLSNEQKIFVLDITSNVTREFSTYTHRSQNGDNIDWVFNANTTDENNQFIRRIRTMKGFIQHFAMVANAYTSATPASTTYYSRAYNRTFPSNLTAEMCKLAMRLRIVIQDAFCESYADRTAIRTGYHAAKNYYYDHTEEFYNHTNTMFVKTFQNCFTYTKIDKNPYINIAKEIRESSHVKEVFDIMKNCAPQDDNDVLKKEEKPVVKTRRVQFTPVDSEPLWTETEEVVEGDIRSVSVRSTIPGGQVDYYLPDTHAGMSIGEFRQIFSGNNATWTTSSTVTVHQPTSTIRMEPERVTYESVDMAYDEIRPLGFSSGDD